MDTAVVLDTPDTTAGDTWNVIPAGMHAAAAPSAFKKSVQDMIERQIEKIARTRRGGLRRGVIKWRHERRYPATVNSPQRRRKFRPRMRASRWSASENVNRNPTPAMGSEISPGCCSRGRAATSGSATATAKAAVWSTTRLRFQRRGPADRRIVLGDFGRAAARPSGRCSQAAE